MPCSAAERNGHKYDTILVKNREGSYKIVKSMLEKGYRKIGLIGVSMTRSTAYERYMGYKMAYEEFGLSLNESIIREGDFLGHNSYEVTKALLSRGICDAIYTINNMNFLGAVKAINGLRLRIPQDIGLATFDDMEWMNLCGVPISAVEQPTYEIGELAMHTLLRRINGECFEPETVFLDVKINIRESTQKLE